MKSRFKWAPSSAVLAMACLMAAPAFAQEPPPAEEDNAVDVVIDGGHSGTEPTTVVDLSGEAPLLVRRGKGPTERLGL